MKTTIEVEFSTEGLDKAIKEVKAYKQSIDSKVSLFAQKLAEAGIPTVNDLVNVGGKFTTNGILSGSDTTHNTYVRITDTGADLVLEGQDVLFIEFGAGVSYNGAAGTSRHPKGAEMGYTIGSYGKGHGRQKIWGFRQGNDIRLTYGTEATMPMYETSKVLVTKIDKIAREVFG